MIDNNILLKSVEFNKFLGFTPFVHTIVFTNLANLLPFVFPTIYPVYFVQLVVFLCTFEIAAFIWANIGTQTSTNSMYS